MVKQRILVTGATVNGHSSRLAEGEKVDHRITRDIPGRKQSEERCHSMKRSDPCFKGRTVQPK